MTTRGLPITERLWLYIEPEPNSGCWLWTGTTTIHGYGTITMNRRPGTKVHRASYEAYKGPIPEGMHVLHKCDVRCCVNPDHLFLGTNADNVADKVAKGRQAIMQHTKHSPETVLAVRGATGSHRAISKRLGVSKSMVHAIKANLIWKHLNTA